jgi:hypothetical protein
MLFHLVIVTRVIGIVIDTRDNTELLAHTHSVLHRNPELWPNHPPSVARSFLPILKIYMRSISRTVGRAESEFSANIASVHCDRIDSVGESFDK